MYALLSVIVVRKELIDTSLYAVLSVALVPIIVLIAFSIVNKIYKHRKRKFELNSLAMVGISDWKFDSMSDDFIQVKSKQAVANLDPVKYFKTDANRLPHVVQIMKEKKEYKSALISLLNNAEYQKLRNYKSLSSKIQTNIDLLDRYFVEVHYSSPAGKSQLTSVMGIHESQIECFENDKSILMSKGEYSKYVKEIEKEQVNKIRHDYYNKVNDIIDFANENKQKLVNKNDEDKLDKLVASLIERTINNINKVKAVDSEEWQIIDKLISQIDKDVKNIINENNRIIDYYNSQDFLEIKAACSTLMNTQREFNLYIDEKVSKISDLFGTQVIRNETINEDEYDYIHTYQKSITPFVAEVSSAVFASAENSPLEYVIKCFYPDKDRYPEQIYKFQTLIEELETLKEAKKIIETQKKDYQQYITDVPDYVMDKDEDGFYARLGFATINERSLKVEYKFVYTSNAGKAQRSFVVPMTEETIIELIKALQNKLLMSAFTKEQRSLMTSSLRNMIKERDNYTCQYCGNSTNVEPNLLLEVDHIIPVSKGGCTVIDNLQTLCWKCNRAKSAKIVE